MASGGTPSSSELALRLARSAAKMPPPRRGRRFSVGTMNGGHHGVTDVGHEQADRRRDARVRRHDRPAGYSPRGPRRRRASARHRRTRPGLKSRGSRPFSTVITRIAPRMLALAMAMMPAAASSTERPSGSATSRWTAARAASASRPRSRPRTVSAPSTPTTRLASETVGRHTALAVARRPGHGAGALRADLEAAAGVDAGDAAAAGADGLDVDHRRAQRVALDFLEVRAPRLPAIDRGDVAAGAAHVEGDEVAVARREAEEGAADDAAHRARRGSC